VQIHLYPYASVHWFHLSHALIGLVFENARPTISGHWRRLRFTHEAAAVMARVGWSEGKERENRLEGVRRRIDLRNCCWSGVAELRVPDTMNWCWCALQLQPQTAANSASARLQDLYSETHDGKIMHAVLRRWARKEAYLNNSKISCQRLVWADVPDSSVSEKHADRTVLRL